MTDYWIDFPDDASAGDDSLDAGLLIDGWRTRIVRTYEQSLIDHQAFLLEGDGNDFYTVVLNTADEWVAVDTFPCMPVPVRPAEGSPWRDISIGFEGYLSDGTEKGYIWAYLLPSYHDPSSITVDTASGLGDIGSYGELSYKSSSWVYGEVTITPPNDIGSMPTPSDDHGLSEPVPAAWLLLIAKATGVMSIYFRGPRIREVMPT